MDGFCEDDQGVHLQIDNDLGELGRVAAALEVFAASCDLDGAVLEALELVLDELLNNTISYGFPDGGSHTITVEIELIDENVVLRISDDGIAHNPFLKETPVLDSPLEQRSIGGLGIYLCKQVMDQAGYERRGGHNIVTLKRKITAAID